MTATAKKNWKDYRDANLEKYRATARRGYHANRDARLAKAKAWRKAHPETMRESRRRDRKKHAAHRLEYQRQWRRRKGKTSKSPTNMRRHYLKHKYGLTPEAYDAMFAKQGGACSICHRPEYRKTRGEIRHLAVDHCHETGLIRELLCSDCNTGIGLFAHSQERLAAAIRYLDRTSKIARSA